MSNLVANKEDDDYAKRREDTIRALTTVFAGNYPGPLYAPHPDKENKEVDGPCSMDEG
jgi:hypothetical protein